MVQPASALGHYVLAVSAETDEDVYQAQCIASIDLPMPQSEPQHLSADASEGVGYISAIGLDPSWGTVLVDWGDGSAPQWVPIAYDGGTSGAWCSASYTYINHVLPGSYCVSMTMPNGVTEYAAITISYPQPTLTLPKSSVFAYSPNVDLLSHDRDIRIGTGPTPVEQDLPEVAVVDFLDGSGPHTFEGYDSHIDLHLYHTPLPGQYTPDVKVYDPWAANHGESPVNYGSDTSDNFELNVWGVKISDGSNDDVLVASDDGKKNLQPVVVTYPHPLGEALNLTLTMSNADALLWTSNNPGPDDAPVLGKGVNSYNFSAPAGETQRTFYVGATKGSTIYDVLKFNISGDADDAHSSDDFEQKKAAGLFTATGVTPGTLDCVGSASLFGATLTLNKNPNKDKNPDATGKADHPYNWLVGQLVDVTAEITAPISSLIYTWDVPGHVLGGYDAKSAKITDLSATYGKVTLDGRPASIQLRNRNGVAASFRPRRVLILPEGSQPRVTAGGCVDHVSQSFCRTAGLLRFLVMAFHEEHIYAWTCNRVERCRTMLA